MKLTTVRTYGLGLCLAAIAVAGCGGDDDTSDEGGDTGTATLDEPSGDEDTSATGETSEGDAAPAGGGTFTLGLNQDPGNLDPQMGAGTSLFTVTAFAYDPLVSVDGETGEIRSALATEWSVDGTTVSFTLADGITCADGTALTATVVADNLNFVANPENMSPFLGTFIPVGAQAAGDDGAGTVTITLEAPAPFVLNGLASLPIVCPNGLADRSILQTGTDGTGPYVLVDAAPGDQYTYEIREGYTWGPNGATTATEGLPATVVVKIVPNETTAANLLLSGELSAAQILGPDADRLEQAGLFHADTVSVLGEQWYNHADGRVTSDPAVRMALTQALDLGELQTVLTSGSGGPATTLATIEPIACPGDSVSGAVPATDPEAAAAMLDEAGWTLGDDGVRSKDGRPLSLTFLYQGNVGAAGDAAAELAVASWKAIGVDATAQSQNETTMVETLFGAGDWDVAWVSVNLNSPDQFVPFLSGPAAPDGTNFAAIANPDYDAAVAEAMSMDGTDGCGTWLDAESQLFAAADLVPFANTIVRTFGSGAEFQTPGQLVPTSIRMVAP